MRKVIFWLEDNWEASLALFLLLAVAVYDSIHLVAPAVVPLGADGVSYIIMAMLAAITLMLVRMRRANESGEIDRIVNRLLLEHAGRNPFIASWLQSQFEFMKSLKNKTFGTTFFEMRHLVEAIRCAEKGDEIQAIDYGPGWRPQFERVQIANIDAAKKGVKITRIFIIPDKIAHEAGLAEGLWATMVEQAENGITIKWVTQEALKRNSPELENTGRGMALFHYGARECSLLMLDVPNAYLALIDGEDLGFEVYWNDHEEVQKRQGYFRKLEGLDILKELRNADPKNPTPFLKRPSAPPQAPGQA